MAELTGYRHPALTGDNVAPSAAPRAWSPARRCRLGALLAGMVLLTATACTGGSSAPSPAGASPPAEGTASTAGAPSATLTATTENAPAAAGTATALADASPVGVQTGASATPAGGTAAATTSAATVFPSVTPSPEAAQPFRVLVPDQPPPETIAAGQWAEVNTQGGCLKVRISFEESSLVIDCLPFKLLVFVDGLQRVQGNDIAHLAGRGYVHPEGLSPVQNPAENKLPFAERPHNLGTVAFTAPDGSVWTVGADGARPVQVTGAGGDQRAGAFYASLAWSPDGAKLLLRREADSSHDVQIYEPGRGLRTIYPRQGIVAPVNPGVAAWSGDSGHVLVTDYDQPGDACDRPTNQYALRSVDVETGAAVELYRQEGTGYIAGVSASPDGHHVAILIGSGCEAVSFGVCLLSLQADPAYRVQTGQVRCPPGLTAGQVAWSPDGKFLAFTSRLQGRGDESELSVGLPLRILEPRAATSYPLAWPLRADRNIIGVVWLPDSRTLRIEEEVPRGLTDTELPDRVIRRITIDGSRFPITELAGDRLLDLRARLVPGEVRGEYVLAAGARGELWILGLGQKDARWQLTNVAAGAAAWAP